jgi:uncharacterized protein YciI
MLVAIICLDKPNSLELRMATRPAHLKWVEENAPPGVHIGPILSDDGASFLGSLWVAEFEDLAAAREFMKNDPYVKAGLFGQLIIQPTRNVAGKAK